MQEKRERSSAAAPYRRLDFPRFKVDDDDDEDGALNRRHQRSPSPPAKPPLLPLHYGGETAQGEVFETIGRKRREIRRLGMDHSW